MSRRSSPSIIQIDRPVVGIASGGGQGLRRQAAENGAGGAADAGVGAEQDAL